MQQAAAPYCSTAKEFLFVDRKYKMGNHL
jgi:hypothetical protein